MTKLTKDDINRMNAGTIINLRGAVADYMATTKEVAPAITRALVQNDVMEQLLLGNWKKGTPKPTGSLNINSLINDIVDESRTKLSSHSSLATLTGSALVFGWESGCRH